MISVVIPLYNKEKTVARALRSVLNQTYQDFEAIVVNDGSTDRSVAEAERFTDPRIRLIHQPNVGVSAARNRGVSEAKADWVAFLDADDEWSPGFLCEIKSLVRRFPSSGLASTNYQFKSESGTTWLPTIKGLPKGGSGILENYFRIAGNSDPPLWTSAVAVRRDALQRVGGFPEGVASGEDLLTWARLAVLYPIAYTQQVLSTYNIGDWALGVPPRAPDSQDAVARALDVLSRENAGANKADISYYIGWWRKTRASLYLRLGERRLAFTEALAGLTVRPKCLSFYVCILACLLPGRLRDCLLKFRAPVRRSVKNT